VDKILPLFLSPFMTSAQIRQSFLDFFQSKRHTIVPSSSLLPDSPNLLFTNAGMNQFVPIFLGQVQCPYAPPRAADTQKCIRAGGKHNDLEDVGLDTYHHTFFEMLGNWSFGDYFKKEAIDWAWELITEVWKFPTNRLYATVYSPDKSKNDPAAFDQDAWDVWAGHFRAAGLDPAVHIVHGNKKDNFWMMGDTGPCGPCSELHVDLTPAGDTRGQLVNQGDARCIEIWNLVFIQFNANPDGTFSPLPAKHVDTGMGFERVASIIQGTKNFADFQNAKISNYETDIFRPIFDELEKLSGQKYTSTLPKSGSTGDTEQEKIDVAFRVIADHIRTLSFAIADGILPGNTDRNYVLRRILRRAVRYGRTLGFHEPFFYKLVDVLAATMGDVFPEIRIKLESVKNTIKQEEEAFNRTLDKGILNFESAALRAILSIAHQNKWTAITNAQFFAAPTFSNPGTFPVLPQNDQLKIKITNIAISIPGQLPQILTGKSLYDGSWKNLIKTIPEISGNDAFELYDTFGFPLDLTELMAREQGFTVDVAGFNALMEEQRTRARAAQKKTVIQVDPYGFSATRFVGFEELNTSGELIEIVTQTNLPPLPNDLFAVVDPCPFYAATGGQVGDAGVISLSDNERLVIIDTQKRGDVYYLRLDPTKPSLVSHVNPIGKSQNRILVKLVVDAPRRAAIERHHTVTHLLHWALHKVVSHDAVQKGSSVTPDKLTFDFNSAALTPQQIAAIEKLVNERIADNAAVTWHNFPYAAVKGRADIMQFFGDKYGDEVRVVQIGGAADVDAHGKPFPRLDGYSMELCGGTHVRATGEIGFFKILREGAVAAGVRRIEAVAGEAALAAVQSLAQTARDLEKSLVESGVKIPDSASLQLFNPSTLQPSSIASVHALEQQVRDLQQQLADHKAAKVKQERAAQQQNAAALADDLAARAIAKGPLHFVVAEAGIPSGVLRDLAVQVGQKIGPGVVVIGSAAEGKVGVVALCSPEAVAAGHAAGKIVGDLCGKLGGKGGGKPDFAQGGGKDASLLPSVLAEFLKSLS
jgi:alanyl-tRNA synthetase